MYVVPEYNSMGFYTLRQNMIDARTYTKSVYIYRKFYHAKRYLKAFGDREYSDLPECQCTLIRDFNTCISLQVKISRHRFFLVAIRALSRSVSAGWSEFGGGFVILSCGMDCMNQPSEYGPQSLAIFFNTLHVYTLKIWSFDWPVQIPIYILFTILLKIPLRKLFQHKNNYNFLISQCKHML